ncbi:Tn5253 CAAX amino terminal protease family [Streptococcus pneumoniae]|uniref:CPBP family intramembrane glutamic endopeptidase n=1 Tax=Streptococcus pneumoniae TaxID=1313 RepID=UPI0005DD227C|nr:CPBP family intramembrane glutamic endopeptidase [Streptococcus pneumoniae]CJB52710.1 Tn5253 CAAX amino terminal protease family [Streptococcus pneumoniae]
MKRIIPVYIFQQVNVLLVSLYLLKFLCIGELTILQVLYGASLFSFLWMYGQRKQVVKVNMKTRMKCLGIGLASLLIISLCFSLIHAQGSTNQTNLIGLQHQVPWFSFLLFLINASMVEEFLYREILWNLVRKLDIRVALTSVLFALVHHPGEGKEGILTTQVTVKAFDEDKKPINFANLLDSLIVSEYQMEPNLWEVSHD